MERSMETRFKFLRFGEGHTSTDNCRLCDPVPTLATGLSLVCGWFPIKTCDAHAEELRMKEAAAALDEKEAAFAAQEFVA